MNNFIDEDLYIDTEVQPNDYTTIQYKLPTYHGNLDLELQQDLDLPLKNEFNEYPELFEFNGLFTPLNQNHMSYYNDSGIVKE